MGRTQRYKACRLASEDPRLVPRYESCAEVCGWHLWVRVRLPLFGSYLRLGRPPTLELVWPSAGSATANINSELLNSSLHRLGSYFLTWKNNFKKKASLQNKIRSLVCKMWRLVPQHVFHNFFKRGKRMMIIDLKIYIYNQSYSNCPLEIS